MQYSLLRLSILVMSQPLLVSLILENVLLNKLGENKFEEGGRVYMDSDEHRNRKKIKLILFTTFFLVVITIGIYNHLKSLPPGLSYEGDIYYTDNVEFLKDLTYEKTNGEVTSEQEIFAEAFKMISEAKDIVVVDMFLFNDYTDQDRNFPDLSGKLTQASAN